MCDVPSLKKATTVLAVTYENAIWFPTLWLLSASH